MVLARVALCTAMAALALGSAGCESSASEQPVCCAAHGEAFETSTSQCEFEGGEVAAAAACDSSPGNGDTVCCVWSGWSPTEVSAFNCDSQGGEVVADGVCSGDIALEDDDDTAADEPDDGGGIPDASATAGGDGPCCVYPDGSVYYVSDEFCELGGGSVETGPACSGEGGPVGGDDTGGDETGGDETGGDETGEDDTGDAGTGDAGTGDDATGDADPLIQEDGTVCCTWPSGVTIAVPFELCDDQNGKYVEMTSCEPTGGSGGAG